MRTGIAFAAWRLGVRSLGVSLLGVLALSVTAATHPSTPARGALSAVEGQAPIEFEVASIKVHPPSADGRFQSSARTQPNGQVTMTNVSVRTLIGRAYPSRGSQQILGLPSWTEGVYYDVIVKANRQVSRDEQVSMWKALLADRMKLSAHYEPREEPSFDLVFARGDHKLGPQMKPSTCTPPILAPGAVPPPPQGPTTPPTGAEVMARCSGFMSTGGKMFAPHTTVAVIASFLRADAGRLIVDKTGLDGFFDVEFSYSTARSATAATPADPSDPPELFTAVQEQLGLKLEPSRAQVEVLVIDRVEKPTEN